MVERCRGYRHDQISDTVTELIFRSAEVQSSMANQNRML